MSKIIRSKSRRKREGIIVALFCLIGFPCLAMPQLEMTVSVEGGSNCAFSDFLAGTWQVGSDIQVSSGYFKEYGTPVGVNIKCVPTNLVFPQDITVHYRLSFANVETYNQPSPDTLDTFITPYYYYGGQVSGSVVYGDYQLGTGSGDYLEFSYTFDNVDENWSTRSVTFKFRFSAATYFTTHFEFSESYEIVDYEQDGGPLDRWFQLLKPALPADGDPLAQSGDLEMVPVPGESVEISGEDVLFDPTIATTDTNGVFGVLAFVDPNAFESDVQENSIPVKKAIQSTPRSGNLILKYQRLIRRHGISGNFCEVIMVEGTVRKVGGSGTISKGDILYPGDKLSLSSGWGEKAQIGLRFINGSNARVEQDVFTNACLTDMLVIGSAGFEDISVISGNTPLAKVSRYMCEQLAGFPNTPEEWAKATGKVIVTTVASSAVPGSGIVAYTVRYGVETAAGKSYDYMMSSGSSQKGGMLNSVSIDGSQRVEITSYYDGSTRVTTNQSGGVAVYNPQDISEPLETVASDQWQEFTDTTGRLWEEGPDSIDKEGPQLRLEGIFDPYTTTIQFELSADDISGLNEATLSAVNNESDVTASFTKVADGLWQSSPISGFPFTTNLVISLEDRLGNETSVDWSADTIPAAPSILRALSAQEGGGTFLEWNTPEGMATEEVLYYEVRQLVSGAEPGSWLMVGPINSVIIPLPDGVGSGSSYSMEVRTCDSSGRIGEVAKSDSLTVGIQGTTTTLWSLY